MSSVMEGVDRLTRIAGQNRVELLHTEHAQVRDCKSACEWEVKL